MQLVATTDIDDDVLTATNIALSEAVWSAATSYSITNRVRPTASGVNMHRLFESVINSNLNHDPLTDDGTRWIEVGVTNQRRMFDGAVQSQSENADSIEVTLQAAGRADVLAIQNASAASLTVTGTDDVDGVVYSHTEELVDDEGVDDWYNYFRLDVDRKTEVTLTDLPALYSDLTFNIALDAPGETVKCGLMLFGNSHDLGGTRWGARGGIKDYSGKEFNTYGEAEVIERDYAKIGQMQSNMVGTTGERAARILSRFRATRCLLIGSPRYASTVIYGFISDWELEKRTRGLDVLSIKFEGLT